jgi:hypothetical protein
MFAGARVGVREVRLDVSAIASKARELYAKTGVTPKQVAADMSKDPTIARDLLSKDVTIPKAYKALAEPKAPEGH